MNRKKWESGELMLNPIYYLWLLILLNDLNLFKPFSLNFVWNVLESGFDFVFPIRNCSKNILASGEGFGIVERKLEKKRFVWIDFFIPFDLTGSINSPISSLDQNILGKRIDQKFDYCSRNLVKYIRSFNNGSEVQ